MIHVRFAPQAERDLVAIGDYLEREAGKRVAGRWIERLTSAASSLADMPFAGVEDPDVGGRRRLSVRPYLILYRIAQNGDVRIVRVVHGARDIPTLLDSEP
jgi:toxin ParE1/3/4